MEDNTVFYAWQNDTSSDCNRYLIRDALKKALANLGRDECVEDCPRLDHDTEGLPGTPSISDAIFEKIGKTKIFVADVTFIEKNADKGIPNPNVMIELGYALHATSSNRIILVMNTAFGCPEQLPFDLRNRRFPICFNLEEGTSKDQKMAVLADLAPKFSHAISAILKIPTKQISKRNLKLHISPTRSGKQQLAQIRLFNSGPGPVFVESWWVQWGPNGGKGGHNSVSTFKGKLPIRLEEQSAAEVLVEIGDNLEDISGIGVFDGDRYLWLASEEELAIFKHNAIAHRLPMMQPDDKSYCQMLCCETF